MQFLFRRRRNGRWLLRDLLNWIELCISEGSVSIGDGQFGILSWKNCSFSWLTKSTRMKFSRRHLLEALCFIELLIRTYHHFPVLAPAMICASSNLALVAWSLLGWPDLTALSGLTRFRPPQVRNAVFIIDVYLLCRRTWASTALTAS